MGLTTKEIFDLLHQVKDPEVPVIDIVELGIVRAVYADETPVRIDITPTYSGCPAMRLIETQIRDVLQKNGISEVDIRLVHSPAWTTEWMSEETKEKLRTYGIAPPGRLTERDADPLAVLERKVACPFCQSENTTLTSQFGSTACKSLHYCSNCQQPFEHFKCI